MGRWWTILGAALLAILPAGAREPRVDAEWTILLYVDADCNLEPFQITMLKAIAEGAASDRVNLIVEIDRSAKYSKEALGGIADFTTTKRIAIRNHAFEEIEDLGECDMGKSDTLASFIAWGIEKYPAKRYGLLLSDHGSAWQGCMWEEGEKKGSSTHLNLADLKTALDAGCAKAKIERLDFLFFECCLMGNLEALGTCRERARYAVVSEDVYFLCSPAPHWTRLAAGLSEDPTHDAAWLAQETCKGWKAFFAERKSRPGQNTGDVLTLAAVDLDKIPAIAEALDKLCAALISQMKSGGRDAWLKIASALQDAEQYGGSHSSTFHCRDLHHFASNLKGTPVEKEGEAVAKAVEAAVLERSVGAQRPNARGISVCFPALKKDYEGYVLKVFPPYAKHAPCPKWTEMLAAYYQIQDTDKTKPELRNTTTTTTKIRHRQMARIKTSVKADDVAEATFFLAVPEAKQLKVLGQYAVPRKELNNQVDFDGTWLALRNSASTTSLVCVIAYDETGNRTYEVAIPALYGAPKATEREEATLRFSVTFDRNWRLSKSSFLRAIHNGEEGPVPVTIEPEGTIQLLHFYVEGDAEPVLKPTDEAITIGKPGPEIVEVLLPKGPYSVGYRLKDHSGNTAFDKVTITVE